MSAAHIIFHLDSYPCDGRHGDKGLIYWIPMQSYLTFMKSTRNLVPSELATFVPGLPSSNSSPKLYIHEYMRFFPLP